MLIPIIIGIEASFAQTNSDSLISVYSKKMQRYLDKGNKASQCFSFTKEGIEIYAPATDTSQKKFELTAFWNEANYFVPKILENFTSDEVRDILLRMKNIYYNDTLYFKLLLETMAKIPITSKKICLHCDAKHLGLLQYRIALDPGHIAGDMETAKKEKKWMEMKNPPLQLIEGELTLATALLLKKKLENEGATVMLTRDKPNQSAFGVDYKKWKDSLFVLSLDSAYARGDIAFEEKNYLSTKANDTEIFRRFFTLEDVRERAKKINAFHPDLTLVIHYNVDEANINWSKPTNKDYNMVFVGGSFAEDELDSPEARIEFLRLLLTEDIEKSIEFSKYMIESLVQKTKVPAALDSNATYLKDNCMKTDIDGVYCRNLTLTRKVKGVICYGESLYQDNINECKALSKKEIETEKIKTSKRVEEVAQAYFEGIMNYVKNKKL